MADDATAVVEPTDAPAETLTAEADAPPSAPEAAPSTDATALPADGAAHPNVTPESTDQAPQETYSKADLDRRISTERANVLKQAAAKHETELEAAKTEAVKSYQVSTDRERGTRAAIEAVWINAGNKAGIDLQGLQTSDPAAFQEIALAFDASSNYGAVNGAQMARAWMTKNHADMPAEAVAKATALAATDPEGAVSALFDAAVEAEVSRRAAEIETKASEKTAKKVQAEKEAMDREKIASPPETPPGTAAGLFTPEALDAIPTSEWIRLSEGERTRRKTEARQFAASRG